jgi:DGQHR domain-containing protein
MILNNAITASKVKQNNQEFLVGIFSIKQLFSFTRFTERLIDDYDEDNKPLYNKRVQRKLENSRVEKIAYFLIDDPDALFPTNIVLSIPNAAIEKFEAVDEKTVQITLNQLVFNEMAKKDGDVYLTIIDGQHRIKGIERAIEKLTTDIIELQRVYNSSGNEEFAKKLKRKTTQLNGLKNIDMIVSFFIDPSLEFQAMVFSTINRTQKTVPQSLVSSLFGLTEKDTPHKSALEIVLALNAFSASPFYNRIKLHGGSYEKNESPPLTQAAMVKSIVDLISSNQLELERDRHRDRKELLINCTPDKPFRIYYAKDQDAFITDILFSFFTAVRIVYIKGDDSLWDFNENTKPTNILQTTVGYQALLSILVDILSEEKDNSKRDKVEFYKGYLDKVKGFDLENTQRYPFTSKSKSILYLDLSIKIWPPKNQNDERLSKLKNILA